MRYVRLFVLGTLAVVLITIALANRQMLTLRLLPAELEGLFGLSWSITLPAFVILVITVLAGVLLGFVWEWVREHRFRAEAQRERRERQKLETKLQKSGVSDRPGDDVLALLEKS